MHKRMLSKDQFYLKLLFNIAIVVTKFVQSKMLFRYLFCSQTCD